MSGAHEHGGDRPVVDLAVGALEIAAELAKLRVSSPEHDEPLALVEQQELNGGDVGMGLNAAGIDLLDMLLIVAAAQTADVQPPAAAIFHQVAQTTREALRATRLELEGEDVRLEVWDLARDLRERSRRVQGLTGRGAGRRYGRG